MSAPAYTVAARTLCEFAAKQGDLDLRFTPSPTSQEGMAGHKTVAERRSAGYRREVRLSGRYKHLTVSGRADGYDPARVLLEEVKTVKGPFERIPANHQLVHWAQAKVYGWLLCEELGLGELDVSLVYFDVRTKRETPLVERHTAQSLRQFFESICESFLDWADRETAHRERRDEALTALKFPHAEFRRGQRALAESVYKAARLGRCLAAQAPTGIGKTIGTIFPLLKACPVQELDKVFFLTAKGSGKALAFQAIDTIRASEPGLPLRVIDLVARDKACEHPDKACHGESCSLAKGFYDRLPQARDAASGHASLTQPRLREIALAHKVCPYYLGQEMAKWSDVVVGDYNHFYDGGGALHGLTIDNQWRVGVLVDEAHNLIERARAMYTAELDQAMFRRLRSQAHPALKKPLDRLHRAWSVLTKEQTGAYRILIDIPGKFASALQDVTDAVAELLEGASNGIDADLLQFYFDALHFNGLLETFDSHSMIDMSVKGQPQGTRRIDSTLCIRNVIPAPFLEPRFAAARTTVLFSATLTPQHFYADTLGLPVDTAWLDVDAPFQAEQLSVRLVRHLSTRFRQRSSSLEPLARLIGTEYEAHPGNYIAFFSSFDYLDQVAEVFAARYPQVPTRHQVRRMEESDKVAFLEQFTPDSRGIGFAVLGGSFAEAIDLPGTRLVGAFIATLGLPPFNPINEEMRRRMEAAFGAGYDYAYLFPGIRKVVQAAGRVIRTPLDRGSVHLIDDRFGRPEVVRLLPRWWKVERSAGR